MTWSEEMRRQAIEDHQFPEDRIAVVGALQFIYYEAPVEEDEVAGMRLRIGLRPDEQYLAYVCGARTSAYDVEDVLAMLGALQQGPYRNLRVVVRPHPQGSRQAYDRLAAFGVLLDVSPDLTSGEERPDALNVPAIRHFAAFLKDARFVLSSWGTTALLEACIFDRPAIQFRWMETVPHTVSAEVQKVRDFQRYIHMRAFDRTGARPYCDDPRDLSRIMNRLEAEEAEFRGRRATAVRELTCLPLGGVVDGVCSQLVRWTARGNS